MNNNLVNSADFPNSSFRPKLIEARKDKGLTQKQVADKLHIAEYRYANWEQGRAEPSLKDFELLCVVLDVTADYMLGLETKEGRKIRKSYHFAGREEHFKALNIAFIDRRTKSGFNEYADTEGEVVRNPFVEEDK